MRPVYLEISAFGAFGGLEIIDFTRIRGGLFLICGETGAGKTTVFDAVSYALYGEMSGSIRGSGGVRSDFADDNQPTYVLLKFVYKGRAYEIRRSPSFIRKSKRGGGIVTERAKVELTLPDGGVIADERNVRARISGLLGLNYSQWKQVAMIAQGEFTKCLHAESGERSTIFRNIFATGVYGRLSAYLKEEELAAKRKYEATLNSLSKCAAAISCGRDNPLYPQLLAASETGTIDGIEKTCDILGMLLSDEMSRHESLAADCAALQKRLDEKNTAIEGARLVNKNITELHNEKKAHEELTAREPEISAKEEFVRQAERALEEITALTEEFTAHSRAREHKSEINKLSEQLSSNRTALESAEKEREKLAAKMRELSATVQNHKNAGLQANIRANELEKSLETVQRLNSLLKDSQRYNLLRGEYKSLKIGWEKMEGVRETAELELAKKQELFIRGQAGLLAERLSEGEPCPVCGSASHPKPAGILRGIPSEADLKALSIAVTKAKREAREAEAALNGKRAEGVEARKNIIREASKHLLVRDEETPIDAVAAEIKTALEVQRRRSALLKEELAALRNDEKTLVDAEKERQDCEANLERLNSIEKERSAEIHLTAALIAQKEGEHSEIRKSLKYQTEDEARGRLEAISEALNLPDNKNPQAVVRERIAQARADIEAYKSELIRLHAKIETLTKLTGDMKPVDIDELAKESLFIKQERERREAEKADAWAAYKSNSELLGRILMGTAELKEDERKYSLVERLSRTANGELKGKQKLTLEMYVQRAYFIKIIRIANMRLKRMTNGRFELLRKQSADNLRDKSFALDLDVLDNRTGRTRDVSSLSGGEAFMAALALALALSDTIQQEAGGVEIGTMFIDEGFGALDPEHLSLVVDTLSALIGGDKLIGVISHVETLKDNIEEQIKILKANVRGSRIII